MTDEWYPGLSNTKEGLQFIWFWIALAPMNVHHFRSVMTAFPPSRPQDWQRLAHWHWGRPACWVVAWARQSLGCSLYHRGALQATAAISWEPGTSHIPCFSAFPFSSVLCLAVFSFLSQQASWVYIHKSDAPRKSSPRILAQARTALFSTAK